MVKTLKSFGESFGNVAVSFPVYEKKYRLVFPHTFSILFQGKITQGRNYQS